LEHRVAAKSKTVKKKAKLTIKGGVSKVKVKQQGLKKVKKKSQPAKDDLSKYEDEHVKEIAIRMKQGCDCTDANCFKGNFQKKCSRNRDKKLRRTFNRFRV
jgi:hypothetical protein